MTDIKEKFEQIMSSSRTRNSSNLEKMSLEQNIRCHLLSYPSIFFCRSHVLHHMFFTLGSGFEWVDGQLLDSTYNKERENRYIEMVLSGDSSIMEKYQGSSNDIFDYWLIKEWKKFDKAEFECFRAMQEQIDERMKIRGIYIKDFPFKLSTFSEDVPFFSIPGNVEPDYFAGAIEACTDYITELNRYKDEFYRIEAILNSFQDKLNRKKYEKTSS